jgi:excisionase family DNA binding protein
VSTQRTPRADVLSVTEVARELRCSPALVRKLVASGKLPATAITDGQRRTLRLLSSDVVAYLDTCNPAP